MNRGFSHHEFSPRRQRHGACINLKRVRRGGMLMEATVALGMIGVAAVLLAQFVVAADAQRRIAHQRRAALDEVANRLERAALVPWKDLSASAIEAAPLPEEVRQRLPGAKLTASVTDEGKPALARKIRISIVWQNRAGVEMEPVVLAAWRFPDAEAEP
jgi:hypothetical protein